MIQFFTDNGIEGKKWWPPFVKTGSSGTWSAWRCFTGPMPCFHWILKPTTVELEHLLKLNPPDYMLVSKAQLEKIRGIIKALNLNTRLIVADLMHVYEDAWL